MADNTIDIRIDVEGNAKNQLKVLGASVNTFEKNTTKSLSVVGAAFASFTGNLAAAGVGAAFRLAAKGVSEFAGILKQGVALAQVQEDAVNKLNTALKLSGQFSTAASKELQEYASALQQTTKFGDEAIIETAALIQSLGQLDKEGLKKATAATLDLSAALGIDLNAAALLVGKAAAGEVSSFSRYGLIIKKGADNAETFATALDAINKKFGGAAAEQVKTFSGAVAQLSNTYGDTLETLGELVTKNQFFTEAIKIVNGFLLELQGTIKGNEDQFRSLLRNGLLQLVQFVSQALLPFLEATERNLLKLAKAAATFRGSINVIGAAFGDKQAQANVENAAKLVVDIDQALQGLDSSTNVYKRAAQLVDRFGAALEKIPDKQREINNEAGNAPAPTPTPAKETDDGGVAVSLEAITVAEEEKTLVRIQKLNERIQLLAEIDSEANASEIQRAIDQQDILSDTLRVGSDARLKIEADVAKQGDQLSAELLANDKKRAKERQDLEKKKLDNLSQVNSQFFGGLASLTQSKSRELFEIGKAAGVAQATVDGALAVQKTLASLPFPLNILAAAGVAVKTGVQISTIASQQFQAERGLTEVPGGFPNDSFPAALTSGERVVSAEQNRDLKQFLESNTGLSSRIDALIQSQMGSRPIVVQVDGSTILDVVQEQVDSGRTLNL